MGLSFSLRKMVLSDVFDTNMTHNVGQMADLAGVYDCLWRPEENGFTTAGQMIEPLTKAVEQLRADPEKFIALNPKNGWGSYDTFLPWIEKILAACQEHPDAEPVSDR